MPNPQVDDRYIVNARGKKGDENLWRVFGINNVVSYGMIMSANYDVPCWVEADLWYKSVIESEPNKMILRATQDARLTGGSIDNIQGYYTYMISKLVPSFLRYFRERGFRISADWVRNEFSPWETVVKKTNESCITLKPTVKHTNPLNELGPVLALGSGANEKGELHAYDGNITPLLDKDEHDFFILMSFVPPEFKKSGGGGGVHDALVDRLKQEKNIFYWIYAVRKDAPLATDYGLVPKITKPLPPVPEVGEKREREEEEEEEYDEDDFTSASKKIDSE